MLFVQIPQNIFIYKDNITFYVCLGLFAVRQIFIHEIKDNNLIKIIIWLMITDLLILWIWYTKVKNGKNCLITAENWISQALLWTWLCKHTDRGKTNQNYKYFKLLHWKLCNVKN